MMSMSPVRVIHNDTEYAAALADYETHFDAPPEPNTLQGDRFELLGLVIAAYEERRWPIPTAEPLDVIRLVMEGRGYRQSDLAALLGSRSRASEILRGRRGLSVDHIRAISTGWRIPVAALIGVQQAA